MDRRKSLTLGGVCVSASEAGFDVTDSSPVDVGGLSRPVGEGKRSVSGDDWARFIAADRCSWSVKLLPVEWVLFFSAERQADDDAKS